MAAIEEPLPGRDVPRESLRRRTTLLVLCVLVPACLFALLALHATRPGADAPRGWEAGLVREAGAVEALQPLADAAYRLSDVRALLDRRAVLVVSAAALLALLARRPRQTPYAAALLALVAANPLLQRAFERPPPEAAAAGEYAFPSGLALGAAACLGWIVLALRHSRWRWPAVAVAVVGNAVVALHGVVSGSHWPTDVLAAWCLAAAALAVAHALATARAP